MPLPKHTPFYGLILTDEQRIYADSIMDNLFTGVEAPAGTGKTTIALGAAKIRGKEVHYIFPTVEEGALGFSTGDVKQKESKYLTPLIDAIVAIGDNPSQAIIGEPTKWGKQDSGWIHAYSHNYMRGGNIKDSTVIIDEAQNLTERELRKILTRIHDSCHVIVMGHSGQIDLKNPKDSGFVRCLDHYSTEEFAFMCALTKNFRGDIARHADKAWG